MIQIAEKFEIQDLIDKIRPLKEEMENIEEYNRFSELEILDEFVKILKTINESNFDVETSFIYSIFIYIGQNLFKNIIKYFVSIYPEKLSLYSRINEMINSRFPENKNTIEYPKTMIYNGSLKINSSLYKNILNDDVDSLQKQTSNPKFNLSQEYVDISISHKNHDNLSCICNALECAAFFGSIKCFKYLILNAKLKTNYVASYAIVGGNVEIIRICLQMKFDFKNCLNIAIKHHKNDIAQWIFENKIDFPDNGLLYICIHSFNYEMYNYFLDMKLGKTPIDDQIMMKFIIYIHQNYYIDVFAVDSYCEFFMKYKPLKLINNYGLIYCPRNKIELVKFFMNSPMNNFINQGFNSYYLISHPISF